MSRALVAAPVPGEELAREVVNLRAEAERRYSEVDLLVAALRDHIRDLRIERDRLRAEIARLRDEVARERAAWLWRGVKPPRTP